MVLVERYYQLSNTVLVFWVLSFPYLVAKEFWTKILVAQESEPFQTATLCPECEIENLENCYVNRVSQNYLLKQGVIACLL